MGGAAGEGFKQLGNNLDAFKSDPWGNLVQPIVSGKAGLNAISGINSSLDKVDPMSYVDISGTGAPGGLGISPNAWSGEAMNQLGNKTADLTNNMAGQAIKGVNDNLGSSLPNPFDGKNAGDTSAYGQQAQAAAKAKQDATDQQGVQTKSQAQQQQVQQQQQAQRQSAQDQQQNTNLGEFNRQNSLEDALRAAALKRSQNANANF